MPFTLTMGLLWFAAAFVLGLATGALVRTVTQRHRPTRPQWCARSSVSGCTRCGA